LDHHDNNKPSLIATTSRQLLLFTNKLVVLPPSTTFAMGWLLLFCLGLAIIDTEDPFMEGGNGGILQ
jgi:hypothetical protein